eukprot:c11419_g1_i1 orf=2-793(-)
MSQNTVRSGPHISAEISSAQNLFSFNTDFARVILSSGSEENLVGNIRSGNEPERDYVSEDFLTDDSLMKFIREDITWPVGNLDSEFSSIHSARSSITNLCETFNSPTSFPRNHNEGAVTGIEQNIYDGNDLFILPAKNIFEPDSFSTLSEVPLIFSRSSFHEDCPLISNTHNFTHGYGIGQFRSDESNINPPCEKVTKGKSSSSSDEAQGFTLRAPVPGRARSKRHRPRPRAWSAGLLLACNTPTNSLDSTSDPLNNTTTTTTT